MWPTVAVTIPISAGQGLALRGGGYRRWLQEVAT